MTGSAAPGKEKTGKKKGQKKKPAEDGNG
jgi:hypothetical protein